MVVAGGLYGLNLFNPDKIHYNRILPKVLLADLFLLGKKVEVGDLSLLGKKVEVGVEYDGNMILEKELNETRKIELNHKQNIFTLELATDNFSLPEKTQYVYKLEGTGNDWLCQ